MIIIVLFSSCASSLLSKGNRQFDQLQYAEAIDTYNKLLAKKYVNEAVPKLAYSYYKVNDINNAYKYYTDAVALPEANDQDYFNYSKILMEKQDYKEAIKWWKRYLSIHPNDVVANMLYASCVSIDQFYKDPSLYTLNPVELDGFSNTFSATPYGNGIVFTGDKAVNLSSKQNPWTGNAYLDLYFTEPGEDGYWLQPEILKGDINGKFHEGPASFTADGKKVFFTRSNYKKKRKLATDDYNESNLTLFSADLVDGKWTNIQPMPFNNDNYSVAHPSLSADEKTLYFVSDMPGGEGGLDIYKSTFDGTNWSEPENLGPEVNTPGNEMFPYIHKDGSLYFSSDAHNNMGGLDVFITSYADGRWLRPENLNYPLNSSKDDFGYYLNDDDSTGYITSSRTEEGNDVIYEFKKNPPTFWLISTVVRKDDNSRIKNATITLTDANGDVFAQGQTNKYGELKQKLVPNAKFTATSEKEGFFTVSQSVSTMGKKTSETLKAQFVMDQLVIEKPIIVENIYYDFDKWFIREDAKPALNKLVKIMKDNPRIVVELGAHTDSRASDNYNLILSDKRAKAAVAYIVAHGISPDRITAKGYGESRLVNRCKNGVKCSKAEHQQNRRTEFKVIRLKDLSMN